jgi:hypothetical protein
MACSFGEHTKEGLRMTAKTQTMDFKQPENQNSIELVRAITIVEHQKVNSFRKHSSLITAKLAEPVGNKDCSSNLRIIVKDH